PSPDGLPAHQRGQTATIGNPLMQSGVALKAL
ncbi:unnamed protein product, partial [marine sediment metagenome]